MADSEPLAPPPTDAPARTGPETVSSGDRQSAGPLPSPARSAAPDGPLTLQTDLLGPLTLPDGAARVGPITGERLSDKAVARLIKQAAADADLDAERFSRHLLRRGLLTAGGENRAGLARSDALVAPPHGRLGARLCRG